MSARAGFLPGMGVGAVLALGVLLLTDRPGLAPTIAEGETLMAWVTLNLGHSSWLFAAVALLFLVHLARLRHLLAGQSGQRAVLVVELDQLTDVWIHVFIGIGVIWTAVGMRGALQAALAEPDQALADTAGSMLRKLVDGGILLALSTTIVGAVGGYLLRLIKTLHVGAALYDFYQSRQQQDVRELLASVRRLEAAAAGEQHPHASG